jgi:hypothetical protein
MGLLVGDVLSEMEILKYVGYSTIFHALIFRLALALWRAFVRGRPNGSKVAVPQLASSATASVHSIIITLWAFKLLSPLEWWVLAAPSTSEQERAMAFSTGYFVAVRSCFFYSIFLVSRATESMEKACIGQYYSCLSLYL